MSDIVYSKSRFIIGALLVASWFLGNLDRNCINFALIDIAKELNFSNTSTGAVLSAFYFGYVLIKVPGGWLADKFGGMNVILVVITIWSLFTIFTGFAWSLVSLLAIRFIFGLAEGSFYPAAMKVYSEKFPINERGKIVSLVLGTSSWSKLIVPALAAAIMLTIGWRYLFYILGALGFVLAIIYWLVMIKQSKTNAEEVASQPNNDNTMAEIKQAFKQRFIWFNSLAYFGLNIINAGAVGWLPMYLANVRHMDIKNIAIVATIPIIFNMLATYAAGIFVDKIPRNNGADKKISAGLMLLTGICVVGMGWAPTIPVYIAFWTAFGLVSNSAEAVILALNVRYIPSAVMGKTYGVFSMIGVAGSAIGPVFMGMLIDANGGSYFMCFVAMGVFAALSTMFSLLMPYYQNDAIEASLKNGSVKS